MGGQAERQWVSCLGLATTCEAVQTTALHTPHARDCNQYLYIGATMLREQHHVLCGTVLSLRARPHIAQRQASGFLLVRVPPGALAGHPLRGLAVLH